MKWFGFCFHLCILNKQICVDVQEEMSDALSSLRTALENEHHTALDALQQQVVALEKQHSAALLEITDITTAEKLQLKQKMDELSVQHQQQLQVTQTHGFYILID